MGDGNCMDNISDQNRPEVLRRAGGPGLPLTTEVQDLVATNDDETLARMFLDSKAECGRLQAKADRAWVVLDWLAENYPAALELCPYKAKR